MVNKIEHPFSNVVAFEFVDEITKEDFDSVIIPEVEELIKKIDKINLVYVLNTDLDKFSLAAWWKDAMVGIQNITKWNKSAIVTDSKSIQQFTEIFSYVMPGEFKEFDKNELEEALLWASS